MSLLVAKHSTKTRGHFRHRPDVCNRKLVQHALKYYNEEIQLEIIGTCYKEMYKKRKLYLCLKDTALTYSYLMLQIYIPLRINMSN